MQFFKIWRPDLYHGKNEKDNFFEGWFYKIVTSDKSQSHAIIAGIHLSRNTSTSHAFIQLLDGRNQQTTYYKYPLSVFSSSRRMFHIQIGPNCFRREGIELDLNEAGHRVSGKLSFHDLKPWPVHALSPGVMGWYAFVPFMECYHGIISLGHEIRGSLRINGSELSFEGGKGYIEKDWGRSFPSTYVWIQSNHFEEQGISLFASIATIPWLRSSFRGFLIGLLYRGRLIRFTTYNRAKISELNISDQSVRFNVTDKRYLLRVEAERTEGALLQAPYQDHMLTRISESLNSRVYIRLYDRHGKLLFQGHGEPAGLDVHGKLDEIIDESLG